MDDRAVTAATTLLPAPDVDVMESGERSATTPGPGGVESGMSLLVRRLYRYFPLPGAVKRAVKGLIFRTCRPLVAHTVAYRAWVDHKQRLEEERSRVDDSHMRVAAREYVSGRATVGESNPVSLQVDNPPTNFAFDDVLIVSGWAFSTTGTIARVDAWLDGHYLGPLQYGTPRPDVNASHDWVTTERCGFFDVLPCPRGLGSAVLRIRAISRTGAFSEAAIVVRQARLAESHLVVDRAERTAAELFIEGWATAPPTESPLNLRLSWRGEAIGSARVHLSRADVWTSMPGYSQAFRSGYRLRCSAAAVPLPTGRGGDDDPVVTLELVGKSGPIATQAVVFRRVDDSRGAVDTAAWTRLMAEHRQHTGHRASVLNWSDYAELTSESPEAVVFTPPEAKAPTLPYMDRSVDFVIAPSDDDRALAEARRVAIAGVLRFRASNQHAGWRPHEMHVDWLERPVVRPLPSASVIIPTFDAADVLRACLEQLGRTVPSSLTTEFLVVDDGSTDETERVVRELAARDPRVRYLRNETNLRFLRSVNRGAAAAQHDVLVLLNNDTLPQPGWLEPLLELLRDQPEAGAVGAKLVYPDGTLQEAGGIIFDDGSGWNYGRGAVDPDHPLYDRVREVDYCSGAVLATWRSLFVEHGGFDERYVPMYYEDADYCFELRRIGRRVYYQPASVVVHLEGYSAGTDITRGIKAYQERNREIFCAKWAEALRLQPPVPPVADRAAEYRLSERHPERVRRALVCSPLMPEFDRESGSKRIYDLIMMLRDAGWQVSFYAQGSSGSSWRYIRLLQQRGVMVYVGHQSPWMGDLFTWNRHALVELGHFDLAIVAFWHVAERFIEVIRCLSPQTRIIVDSIDLHFLREMRRMLSDPSIALLPSGGEYLGELAREINAYRGADAVFAVSEKEEGFINDIVGIPKHALTVALAERSPGASPRFDERRGILMLGSFRHRPNLEAAEYFLNEILPMLSRQVLKDHPIYIVGTDLEKTRLARTVRDPLVRLVGWVPEVKPYLNRCRITILPLRHGAGTKGKLIQALMHGTPSVSTSVGTEGLGLSDGEHVLVANEPSTFAEAMERLLTDRALWERLSDQGRGLAEAKHGYDEVGRVLNAAIDDVLRRPVPPQMSSAHRH